MGWLENEERKRAERLASEAQAQRDAEARRQAEDRAYAAQAEARLRDSERIQALRSQAIQGSAVPQVFRRVTEATETGGYLGSEYGSISVGSEHRDHRFSDKYTDIEREVQVSGRVDGGVDIIGRGTTTLSASEARDPSRVANAFERAFKDPKEIRSEGRHEPPPPREL